MYQVDDSSARLEDLVLIVDLLFISVNHQHGHSNVYGLVYLKELEGSSTFQSGNLCLPSEHISRLTGLPFR